MHSRTISAAVLATFLAASSAGFAGDTAFESVADPSGCQLQKITSGPLNQYQHQGASRDGNWLFYTRAETDEGPYQSFLLNLETGEKKELPPEINNTGSLSPTNRELVAAVYVDEKTDIVELDLDSGEITTIAANPAWEWLPSYSPDGKTIVFNSTRTGSSEIYLYDRQSGDLTQLTDYDGYDAHAEFSPDGSKLMFHRMASQREGGGYDFDLFAIDLETRQETRLTESPFENSYGSWSADGTHFVYSSDFEQKPEKHNLYIRAVGGDESIRITEGDWKDSYAFWSRDGKYIYFHSDRDGTTQIYRVKMDGNRCFEKS